LVPAASFSTLAFADVESADVYSNGVDLAGSEPVGISLRVAFSSFPGLASVAPPLSILLSRVLFVNIAFLYLNPKMKTSVSVDLASVEWVGVDTTNVDLDVAFPSILSANVAMHLDLKQPTNAKTLAFPND
jgi:hypothetical protein